MMYTRGNSADFTSWGAEWSWSSLLPYFLKGEKATDINSSQYHGTDGVLPVSYNGKNMCIFGDQCKSTSPTVESPRFILNNNHQSSWRIG